MSFARRRNLTAVAVMLTIGLGAWIGLAFGSLCYFQIGLLRFLCPLGFLELCVNDGSFSWHLLPYSLFGIAVAMLVGRAFCGWMCPFAFVTRGCDTLLHKILPGRVDAARMRIIASIRKRFRKFSYKDGLALFIGGIASTFIFKYPFLSAFCPIGIVTRNTITFFKNLQVHGDLLLLAIPLATGLVFVGGWMSCCPVGVFQGVAGSHHKALIPAVNPEKCLQCGTCAQVCPFDVCLLDGNYDEHLCVKCLSCLDCCPNNAVHIRWFGGGNSCTDPDANTKRSD